MRRAVTFFVLLMFIIVAFHLPSQANAEVSRYYIALRNDSPHLLQHGFKTTLSAGPRSWQPWLQQP
jgi:hypothetical protein